MPPIYHFTHGRNLPSILANRELRPSSTAATTVDIADSRIKTSRETRAVTCGRGGFVGDYVPFYFAPRSPMLYRIQRGGVEGVDGDPRGIIYLRTTTARIQGAGLDSVFTDGNAAAAVTRFEDDLALLDALVDWPLMEEMYWHNTEDDGDRVRRRGAEFLVKGPVPLELIEEIGVYGATSQARVREILAGTGTVMNVNVRRDWYFSPQ